VTVHGSNLSREYDALTDDETFQLIYGDDNNDVSSGLAAFNKQLRINAEY
jgi:hypothetical protein